MKPNLNLLSLLIISLNNFLIIAYHNQENIIKYNSEDNDFYNNCNIKNKQVEQPTNDNNKFLNDLDDVQKLKRLFLIYTANEKKLHSQKFLKLVSDAGLLDKDFDSKYADILFFAGSKSKTHIEFSNFCEIILKICEIKFPLDFIKNQVLALNNILNGFLFPLLNKIYSSTYSNRSNSNYKSSGVFNSKGPQSHIDYTKLILKINSNIEIKEVLEKHLYLIIKIHQKYFPWESLNIGQDKKINLSEKSFVKFCKDFEIQPNLISLVKLNDIYINSTLNTKLIFSVIDSIMDGNVKNQGSYFTLYHFITCLYLLSVQSILQTNQNLSSHKNTINNEENYQNIEDFDGKNHTFKNKGIEVDYKIEDFAEGQDISKLIMILYIKITFKLIIFLNQSL